MASSRVGASTIACGAFCACRARQDRQGEGGGLAGAGLRLAQHVLAGQQGGMVAAWIGEGVS
jgi:hypothetical protein